MHVTIKEVAQKAGVSTATVSRVFNKVVPVEEGTRQRVLEIARELRYTSNAVGRSLSTRRTDAIGLLLPDLYGEFFSEVIQIVQHLIQHGHRRLAIIKGIEGNLDAMSACAAIVARCTRPALRPLKNGKLPALFRKRPAMTLPGKFSRCRRARRRFLPPTIRWRSAH